MQLQPTCTSADHYEHFSIATVSVCTNDSCMMPCIENLASELRCLLYVLDLCCVVSGILVACISS